MAVRVQQEDFDVGAESRALQGPAVGAIALFVGTVRSLSGNDSVTAMTLEHYPGMTERAIESILAEAVSRWDLGDALVIHRYGSIPVGAPIMMVATAAPHRSDAFQAAEFLMDYLKSRAPFWKKEVTRQGSDWVAAQDHDEDALKRW